MVPRFYQFELVDGHAFAAGLGGVSYGGEGKRVHLDTKGGNVLLLEFTSQVALDEGGLVDWVR